MYRQDERGKARLWGRQFAPDILALKGTGGTERWYTAILAHAAP